MNSELSTINETKQVVESSGSLYSDHVLMPRNSTRPYEVDMMGA